MSVYALSWVLRHSDAKLGARLVLLVLADHARDDGTYAWPAVETIAQHSRMSRRAVQDALRKLEADGAVRARGRSKSGTVIYDVVLGGAESARGAESDVQGAQNLHGGGEAASPNPSKDPSGDPPTPSPEGSPSNGRRIIPLADEPIGFSEWLGYHKELTDRDVPRAGTSARSELARTFAALMGEGYSLEEFKLASEGVWADEFMRAGGWVKPENVLRKTKIAGRVEDGRRAKAARAADPYAAFDGGDSRG